MLVGKRRDARFVVNTGVGIFVAVGVARFGIHILTQEGDPALAANGPGAEIPFLARGHVGFERKILVVGCSCYFKTQVGHQPKERVAVVDQVSSLGVFTIRSFGSYFHPVETYLRQEFALLIVSLPQANIKHGAQGVGVFGGESPGHEVRLGQQISIEHGHRPARGA